MKSHSDRGRPWSIPSNKERRRSNNPIGLTDVSVTGKDQSKICQGYGRREGTESNLQKG